MDVNYFVCTLGQAALPGVSRPFRNVNHLVDQQALQHPDRSAIGFFAPDKKSNNYKTYVITFREVSQGIRHIADAILNRLSIPKGQTVGLLCNSSPAFLFTWLGLVRLGHPVLLIAPQCSASAIVHLSKACDAPLLFTDSAHEKLADDAVRASSDLGFAGMEKQKLPFEHDEGILLLVRKQEVSDIQLPDISDSDVAYLHHTSGTSTGIPKPIPQTHKGGVGVLPSLEGSSAATFTTTPLYHGGVADLFRAWTSTALIWLFPGQHAPITASNVLKCLDASKETAQKEELPRIKYFSSVPYVLQMMAQDVYGIEELQSMDIVGVGGAALPPEVGDKLVNTGVNLVSRYGSAECGFLMSSHREYKIDKEWQYLRKSKEVQHLKLEEQPDGLSELVILPGWPHMAKTNREDGSFATSDLLAPHDTIRDAWKYHSRADSQLTLITGKKFDPAPLEGSLAASLDLISEVMIFGNGKPYPGALLFRSEAGKEESDEALIQKVAPIVENLNKESQSHARIPRNMLIPMAFEPAPLEKSSKGTILRSKCEDKYHDQVENAYSKTTFVNDHIDDKDIPDAILKVIESVVGTSHGNHEYLTQDTDLFSFGVDSVACVQVRHALMQMLHDKADPLPLTIVEDSSTVRRLSQTIIQRRRGGTSNEHEDQKEIFESLVKKYSSFQSTSNGTTQPGKSTAPSNILLTGPTGLLGAHVLSQLLDNSQVKKVYLLVRGASHHAARERVRKSLLSRCLTIPSSFDDMVVILPCKISDANLGLSDSDYRLLTFEIDTVIHLAWSVNFLISLRSLATTHLVGLQNMLNFALSCVKPPRFLFCSSVAGVSNLSCAQKIPEGIVNDFSAAGPTGYSQSKLAAELICANYAEHTAMRGRITVLRVGQLSGDTEHGAWNMTEAYPLLLESSKVTGMLPQLRDESLSWLPVDIAAKAYLQAVFRDATNDNADDGADDMRVLHILNASTKTTYNDLATWIKEVEPKIKLLPIQDWLWKLGAIQKDDKYQSCPALKLLPFWKMAYGEHDRNKESKAPGGAASDPDKNPNCVYEMEQSRSIMPSLDTAIGALDKCYMMRLWNWIKHNSE